MKNWPSTSKLSSITAKKYQRSTIRNGGIPVAAGVLYPAFGLRLSPIFAGAAMVLSSVSVDTNALRLNRVRL